MNNVTKIVFASKFSNAHVKIIRNHGNPILLLIGDSESRELWINALTDQNLVDLGELIDENANTLAEEFNKSIADQLRKTSEPFSILTRTFERNTLVSELFQDCVFAIVGSQVVKRLSHITIVTDRIGVAKDLSNSESFKTAIKYNTEIVDTTLQIFRDLKRIGMFCLWFIGNLFAVRNLTSPNARMIIHSFADQQTKSTKRYEERYFPGLYNKFKDAGYEPSMFISNAGFYPRRLWVHLIEAGLNPTLEFKYLKLSFIPPIVWKAFKIRKCGKGNFIISGILLNETLKQSFQESRFDLGTFQALTRYWSLNSLLSESMSTEEVIFLCEYEGMLLEKAAALVRKKYSKEFKIIGIQHGAIFTNLLCTFPTNWELENTLLPNKIVCNGVHFQAMLSSAKIPKDILAVGPALRYSFLHNNSGELSQLRGTKIFVPLPLTKNQEIKTIKFIEGALGSSSFQVLFKPHPISTSKVDLEACVNRNSNFAFTELEFKNVLGEIGIVVGQTTGSLLEFVLLGYPVIQISNPYEIEFDALESIQDGVMKVSKPEQLKSAIISSMANYGLFRKPKVLLINYFNDSKDFDLGIYLPNKVN